MLFFQLIQISRRNLRPNGVSSTPLRAITGSSSLSARFRGFNGAL
jgi:hypothetical protein